MKLRKLDENQAAARVVAEVAARHEKPLPADFEAAWAEWSAGVQKMDTRTMALLKAAFRAAWEAATCAAKQNDEQPSNR